MLTSDTTSMLAISIRMPTSTGGPARGGGREEGEAGAGVRRRSAGHRAREREVRAPHLRSQAWGGYRSRAAACPPSPSRRTCCWAHRRCGKEQNQVREAAAAPRPSPTRQRSPARRAPHGQHQGQRQRPWAAPPRRSHPGPGRAYASRGRLQVGTERSNNCRQRSACAERSAVGTGIFVSLRNAGAVSAVVWPWGLLQWTHLSFLPLLITS